MQEQYHNNYQNQYYNTQPNRFNNVVFVPVEPKSSKEKKSIKKTTLLISLSCLIMMGITFIWATAFSVVMRFLGFSENDISNIITDPYVLQVIQTALSLFMFTLPFVTVFKLGGYSVSDTVPLIKPNKSTAAAFILIGVGFCAFANISVSIAGSVFEGLGIDYNVNYGENPTGIIGFILSFIATAIVPALVEEFACRGLILGSLKKYGEGFAIVTSAAVFGLMHGNFRQIPFAFLVGLVLGYITVKSGTLWLSCAVHSINNCVSVFMDYALGGISTNAQNLIYNCYLMVSLLAAIVGICLLFGKDPEALKLDNGKTECEEKEKYKAFFTSPLIIVFACICLIESMVYFIL